MTTPGKLRLYLALVLLLGLWSGARFYGLEQSPPGFYIDESSTAMNILCLAQRGENFTGDRHPLFPGNLGGGHNSPTFTYFGVVWTKIFGTSIAAFRSIAAFFAALAIVGVFLLGRTLWGAEYAIFASLALAASPWAFQSSRVAWDAGLPLCFLPWALFFFLRAGAWWNRVVAGVLFALAMYSYGASRIQTPLLIALALTLPLVRRRVGTRGLAISAAAFATACLPLFAFTFLGQGMNRFRQVGMTTKGGSPLAYVAQLVENISLHFHPRFLFAHGDANLRHSTYFFGQLGWLDALALLLALGLLAKRSERRFLVDNGAISFVALTLFGIFAGVLPAALTWDSLPHALRSSGAAPFFALLSGWFLWRASQHWRFALPAVTALALVYTGVFMESYFVEYPRVAAGYYDTYIKDSLESGGERIDLARFVRRNSGYHEIGLRYYVAHYWDTECGATKRVIEEKGWPALSPVARTASPPTAAR